MAWPQPGQRLWIGGLVIAAMCVASLIALAATPDNAAITGGPLTKFFLFGFGMLLATLHTHRPLFKLTTKHLLIGAVSMLGVLAISSVAYDRQSYLFNPACGIAFFLMVGMVAFSGGKSRLTTALSWRPLVHLGDVSYGIYLWHEPLHHVLFNSGLLSSSYLLGVLELGCASVALATGTYYLVEKPALRIKNRWAAPQAHVALGQPPPTPLQSGATAV